jgi:isopentenyl-diphosphate delta-isomerase
MHDNEELVILVDGNDNVVGTEDKLATHRAGVLHRAFSVIIWDKRERLLLQKRNVRKYHSGGLWANACCGHPRPDENVAAAASRRLEEEMGFRCPLEALGTIQYRAELDNGMIEHELVHVFRGIYDGEVLPNSDEVESYRWSRLEDVRSDIDEKPEHFTAWFRKYVAAKWPMALGGGE